MSPRTGRRVRASSAGCALMALLAGCGSTVAVTGQRQQGADGLTPGGVSQGSVGTGPGGATGQLPQVVAGAPAPGVASGGAGSVVGSTVQRPASSTAPGAAGPPGTSSAADVIAPTGRAWDRQFVYLGVVTQQDVNAVAGTFKVNGFDGGDQAAAARAVAEELNRRGGLFGRTIKIVIHDVGSESTAQDPNTAGAQTCAYFSQDRPVIAVLNPVTLMDVPSFRACMAKVRVPLFSNSVAAVDQQVGAALHPYFYDLDAPTWDVLAPVMVSRLRARGYFGGWNTTAGAAGAAPVRVGVLVADDPVGRRVAALVLRALSVGGHPGAEALYGTDPASAVLKFASDGITHVIAVDTGLFPFQAAAASQNYHPRYGFNSGNLPWAFMQSNQSPGQNTGAMGVGWSPSLDVDDAHDPGPTSTAEPECLRMFSKAGLSFAGKRIAEAVAFGFCDGIRLLAQGAVAGRGLSGTQLYQGIQQIAPTFGNAFALGNGLGPQRLFTPGAVRDMKWDTGCSCMRYTSSINSTL
jgi:hypothetical protein